MLVSMINEGRHQQCYTAHNKYDDEPVINFRIESKHKSLSLILSNVLGR